tara:strand:- start:205 stop:810 length:606 start_codon:yes stop_codon:yes gene_type:complete
MPKTTPTKQKTNNSSSSARPISSRTRKAASNLLTINNTSSSTPNSSSSSTPRIHSIPLKRIQDKTDNAYTRRLFYISCSSWFTVDTYLEPLQRDKKDKKQIKVGDRFHILNPLSNYNEVKVERISADGKMCAISRINLNKVHEFQNKKCFGFLQLKYEFKQGKGKVNIDILRNQEFCRRKATVTKYHSDGYISSPIRYKKE